MLFWVLFQQRQKKTVTMGQVNHASTGVYVVWLSTSKTAGDVLERVSAAVASSPSRDIGDGNPFLRRSKFLQEK